MAGPAEFERNMRRHGRNVERNAAKMVRKAALAIDTAVVLATPVDTGRARANWQASLNAPAGSAIEAYSPGAAGSTGAANAAAAMEQAKGVIAGHKPGQSIYLTNNLPYIGKLNDGHSAQAPAGFVQKAVLVGAQAIRGFSVVRETRE